jgi:hypothetical protein
MKSRLQVLVRFYFTRILQKGQIWACLMNYSQNASYPLKSIYIFSRLLSWPTHINDSTYLSYVSLWWPPLLFYHNLYKRSSCQSLCMKLIFLLSDAISYDVVSFEAIGLLVHDHMLAMLTYAIYICTYHH